MSKNPEILKKRMQIFVFLAILALLIRSDAFALDASKYISIDEIKPGMEGYALTVYSGTKIEKFALKVVSVAKKIQPGRDAFFVIGTDPRFVHTGPVQGCSGSPVYIDGRIAGALAFGWGFAKDALYGVTPIEEMLGISDSDYTSDPWKINNESVQADFSAPLDINTLYKRFTTPFPESDGLATGIKPMKCPLLTSIPAQACVGLDGFAESMGLSVVPGVGSGDDAMSLVPNFEPGSVLAVPLAEGDIKMAVVGTVTEVDGDKVYGFGHPFMGQGGINLPMSTGQVHMVVANLISSFKFAQSGQLVGALRADEAPGVYGVIGETAPTIPMRVKVRTYQKAQAEEFCCQLAVNNFMTPMIVQGVTAGTLLMRGALPAEHTLKYSAKIGLEGREDIVIDNVSSQSGPMDVLMEVVTAVGVVMNNPYDRPAITDIELEMNLINEDSTARIWALDSDNLTLKPGQEVRINLTTEAFRSQKQSYEFKFMLPEDIKPGRYQIKVGGADMYLGFLRKAAAYKFATDDFKSLMSAIQNIYAVRRDHLYCVLEMPNRGISIENSPLRGLPVSKMSTLLSPKRAVRIMPVSDWVQNEIDCGQIVIDNRVLNLKVEEK